MVTQIQRASWLIVLTIGISGCGSSDASRTPDGGQGNDVVAGYPIEVACTTGMVADMVRRVGGEHVEISQLMPADVDPHLYQASTKDVRLLQQADVIFYSGLHLEGKMADVFETMRRKKVTVALAESLDHDRLIETTGGQHDPHVWFDLALWSGCADAVAKTLGEYDEQHADEYQAAAKTYRDELLELDTWCRDQLASVPANRRVLVTAHDAFEYFGRAYDVEVRGIQGISTDSEAGLREINALVDFIVDRQVKAVFVETTVPQRNVQALVEGCAQQGHEVIIGGELYSDALGQPGSGADTYVGMIHHNVETIVSTLN